jgi:hypothetical protein
MPRQINLDALIDPGLSVVLNGETVPVRPIDGACYKLLNEKGTSVEVMYTIAARCLPSMTLDQVDTLTPVQVGAVVQLAAEGVQEVEALASPNSAGEPSLMHS